MGCMFCPLLYFYLSHETTKVKFVLLPTDKSFVNLKKGSQTDMRMLATKEDVVKMSWTCFVKMTHCFNIYGVTERHYIVPNAKTLVLSLWRINCKQRHWIVDAPVGPAHTVWLTCDLCSTQTLQSLMEITSLIPISTAKANQLKGGKTDSNELGAAESRGQGCWLHSFPPYTTK